MILSEKSKKYVDVPSRQQKSREFNIKLAEIFTAKQAKEKTAATPLVTKCFVK